MRTHSPFRLFAPAVAALALVATVRPVSALPDASRLTVSPNAGVLVWSEWSDVHDDIYYGGSVGVMINRHLGVEATLGYNPTIFRSDMGREVLVRHLGLDLKYQIASSGWIRPYLSAGWTEFRYDPKDSGQVGDYNGWEFGAGALVPLREASTWRASLRLDARDAMAKFDPPLPTDDGLHHNFLFTLGLQVEIGENYHKDDDGDGIINRVDSCPKTLRGAVVDGRGCAIDSDGDGVFDGLDKCMGTPAGAVIDSLGCPIDSDGDGVFDGLDKCADTPKGAVFDASGCPIDSDGDKIFDGLDKCPDTPNGVKVDEFGCPAIENAQEQELVEKGTITLTSLEFESGKAELEPESTVDLRNVAQAMRKWEDLRLEIGGHTDARGSDGFNLELSQDRAEAVRQYLIATFDWIDGSRLTAVGFGETVPVSDNETESGRQANRRVEFKILGGGPARN